MTGLIPDTIRAGATLDIPVVLTAYPAPDWGLKLILRGPEQIDLDSADDDAAHSLGAAASVTSDWAPGKYWWQLRAIRGAEVVIVEDGQLTITPDLALVEGAHDGRTHAERVLDAINAVIEGRASIDQESYTIKDRSLNRTPLADLIMLKSKYEAEVARERRVAKGGNSLFGRQIKVRFR